MGVLMNPDNWEDNKHERYDHWRRIRAARADWNKDNNHETKDVQTYFEWLEQTHGIKVHLDQSGNITEYYDIVDEHKYFLFMLKYV